MVRVFYFNGIRLGDPGEGLSVEQVQGILSNAYPEIATATLIGPEAQGSTLRYEFRRAIGDKG